MNPEPNNMQKIINHKGYICPLQTHEWDPKAMYVTVSPKEIIQWHSFPEWDYDEQAFVLYDGKGLMEVIGVDSGIVEVDEGPNGMYLDQANRIWTRLDWAKSMIAQAIGADLELLYPNQEIT